MAARQLQIVGTEPEQHSDIDVKAEVARAARREHKVEQDQLKHTWGARVVEAEKDLAAAMLAAGVARYEYTVDGARYRLDLNCPDPTVKLTFVGNEE